MSFATLHLRQRGRDQPKGGKQLVGIQHPQDFSHRHRAEAVPGGSRMSRALPRVVAASPRVVPAPSVQGREQPRVGAITRLPCVLTAALVGLVFLAPSPLRATTTSDSDRHDQQGLMWPVQGKVTSRFGPRGLFHLHRGVDIKAPRGTLVHAAAAGTVAFSGRQSSYGRVIKIDHPNGLRTIYAHNSRNFVKVGERVDAGEVIGAVGQTGRATTNHLHFEVRRYGVARDPLPLLDAAPVEESGGSRLRTAAVADSDSGLRDGVERHGHLRVRKSHHGRSAQLHSRQGSTTCHTRTCRAARVTH